VLSVADMYLLPGLKRLCGRSLAQLLDEDSVVGVWRVAKLFRLARLEDQCTEYMASTVQTYSAIEEAQQRLRALEDLLVSIGLDC